MNDALCTKYGCDYQLDLDGQVTCSNCGAMDDDMTNPNVIEQYNANTNSNTNHLVCHKGILYKNLKTLNAYFRSKLCTDSMP